jgi:hypothetical protein
MDAPALSAERQQELDELRSRAYGPDADIDRDADALARLIELEELARLDAPEPVAETGRSTPTDTSASSAGGPTVVILDGEGDPVNSAGPVPDPEARRRWWRRVPLWAYIAGALAIGLAVGFVVPPLLSPHPATTLQQVPVEGAPLDFQMYGIPASSPVRYEPFHDLEVWSAQTESGSTCIVVTTDTGEWTGAGCAPEPLDAMADVTFFAGMRPIDGLELPEGSVLRFLLRGDVMEVWIAETLEGA